MNGVQLLVFLDQFYYILHIFLILFLLVLQITIGEARLIDAVLVGVLEFFSALKNLIALVFELFEKFLLVGVFVVIEI